MHRVPVFGSNIVGAGYDGSIEELELRNDDGNIIRYFDVPRSVFREFLQSADKDSFVENILKPNYRHGIVS